VDGAGNAYVTGQTASDQTAGAFPVTGGPDLTFNGGTYDAFVAKVNAAGTALVYAGYIGGAGDDYGVGIAVDGAGNAYVTGLTSSDQTADAFPVAGGPDLTFNGGSTYGDAFVAKVNAVGDALVYAGYIGGAGDDYGRGIALDGTGNAYVTGYTDSIETTFPVTGGPDLTYNYNGDAFVAKVSEVPAVQFSSATYSALENSGAALITVTLDLSSAVTATVSFTTSDGTASGVSDYAPVSQTLTFAPGATVVTVTVPITDDVVYEGNETTNLELSNPNGATLGAPNTATLTIVDDDPIVYKVYLPVIRK